MTSLREHEALHVPGIVLQDAQVGIDHTSLAWSLRRVTTEGVGFGAQGLFRPTDKKLARPVLAKPAIGPPIRDYLRKLCLAAEGLVALMPSSLQSV